MAESKITVERWPTTWGEPSRVGDILSLPRTSGVVVVTAVDEEAMELTVESDWGASSLTREAADG
jgi:hypothetical protein